MSQPVASSTRGLLSTRAVRGRGVGRRGRHLTTQPGDILSESHPVASSSKPSTQRKPPLTHFISLPIGHHPSLQERVSRFTTALRNNDPPIPGLDDSIIIPPRRLHLTLGVMSLSANSVASPQATNRHQLRITQPEAQTPIQPLSSALALLMALKPRIMSILGTHKLRIALDNMDIMKPDRGDLDRAHVLWLGPVLEGEDTMRLKEVCMLVNKAFIDAGLLVDECRPLKLHCTIVNTIHRKPRSKTRRRQPFSYSAILASTAFRTIAQPVPTGMSKTTAATAVTPTATGRPVSVNFGVWDVDEIQICEMGSGPEGEYISRGGCSLVDGV